MKINGVEMVVHKVEHKPALTEIKPIDGMVKPPSDQAAMKKLIESLDSDQRSVKQMPGTHKMAKNGKKHPASNYLVGGEFDESEQPVEEQISPKQSFKDVFKSMEEADDEKYSNLEKELHSALQKEKKLLKGENGKYDLSETEDDNSRNIAIQELLAQIRNLNRFGKSSDDVEEEIEANNGETYIVIAKNIIRTINHIRGAGRNQMYEKMKELK